MENYPKFLNKTGDIFVDFIIKQIIFHYNITIFTFLFIPSFIFFNDICSDILLTLFASSMTSIILLGGISLIFEESKYFSSDYTINGKSEYMIMYNELNNKEDEK